MTKQTISAKIDHEPSGAKMHIRARGRSFLALVLSPEAPLSDWLDGLDYQMARSTGFFAGRPVILDLCLVSDKTTGLDGLQDALCKRGIRPIGIESADPSWSQLAHWVWPTPLEGGRASGALDFPTIESKADDPVQPPTRPAVSLILDRAIRSGQRIMHLDGDIVVLGSVASGAELVAGGSIHVYGALRGRAVAGVSGQRDARIFAARMQAELLAIDGFYKVAEEIDTTLHNQPAQAQLCEDRVSVTKLP